MSSSVSEMLDGYSFAYVALEYFDNGDSSCKGTMLSKEKLSPSEVIQFFDKVGSKIMKENTEEERQTKQKMKTFLLLCRFPILFNENTGLNEFDILNSVCELSAHIEGEIYKDTANE